MTEKTGVSRLSRLLAVSLTLVAALLAAGLSRPGPIDWFFGPMGFPIGLVDEFNGRSWLPARTPTWLFWLLYLALMGFICISKHPKVALRAYAVFVILLVLNVHGCATHHYGF